MTTQTSSEITTVEPMEIQNTESIMPVRPIFVNDEENEKLVAQANSITEAILVNPSNAEVTVQLYSLGSDSMGANSKHVSLMDTKVGFVLQEIQQGSPVNKTLTQIKANLDLINPAVVGSTEQNFIKKGFFTWMNRTVSRLPKGEEVLTIINERKDSVADTIEGLKTHLLEEKDKALRNAMELSQISNKLFETQQDLQEATYVGQMVWAKLSEAKATETNPVNHQALSTLVNDLGVQVVDIQTVDTLNVQSRLSAETLISSSRKIEQGVGRVTNVLLPAVQTNLIVKAAAAQQAQLVATLGQITQSAEQTIQDTAKQTRDVAVNMERMQSQGMINTQTLQNAMNEVIQMVDEIDAIRSQTEVTARETSKALGELSGTMRKYADPMTNARHALEKVGEQ